MGGAQRASKAPAMTYICSCSACPPPDARRLRVSGSQQQLERGRKKCEEAGGWWAVQVSERCAPVPGHPAGLGRAGRESAGSSHETSPTDIWLTDHRLGCISDTS